MAEVIDKPSDTVIDTSYVPEVNLPNVEPPDDTQEVYKDLSKSILDQGTEAKAEYEAPEIDAEPDRADYVDDKSLVSTQLSELLSSDSKYMKAVDQGAREQSAALGMTDTSMGVGAGILAGIKSGVPIATADAETYGKAQQLQQQAANTAYGTSVEGQVSGKLQKQKYSLLNESQALQASFDVLSKGADAESQVALQQYAKQWDFAIQDSMSRLEYNLNSALQNKEFEQSTIENVRAQAASMLENNQISIENMLKDPDILELGAEAVGTQIDNLVNLTTSGIQFLYKSAGLRIDSYMDGLLTEFENSVKWG